MSKEYVLGGLWLSLQRFVRRRTNIYLIHFLSFYLKDNVSGGLCEVLFSLLYQVLQGFAVLEVFPNLAPCL